ncbi:MAG: PAS domain S-box protein, partial [Acidobacteria bacterium]|nr:PAS domain S-box protein [Acidobacteriota bacterium]
LSAAVREALERAEHEQQVARSEPWLQTLLERANIGVFRTTLDQRLIEANPALLRLLGVKTLEEALRMNLPTHFFPEAGHARLESEASATGDPQARLVEIERPDGSTAWLNMTEVLLLDVDGEIVVDVLVQDLSHLKHSEQSTRLKLAELEQANADLAGFASIASHELKAP